MKLNFPQSTADIKIDTIKKNLEAVKNRCPEKKILAVVKCDAYSHGAVRVAGYIQDEVDWYGVATVDEGIELRMGRIQKPILVFGIPTSETAPAYLTHNLTATVSHPSHFSILMDGTRYQLNFDTGMHRLGLELTEAESVRQLAVANHRLVCSGIYSHYATADDPGSEFVNIQHERFKQVLSHFGEIPLIHQSNSGALFHYPDLDHFGMVRVGLAMLGYLPGDTQSEDLKPALIWKTKLIEARSVKRGEGVSYNLTWRADQPVFIGTIPVGYGDGIPRSLSNKLHVYVNKQNVASVGNITMDYFMVHLGFQKPDLQKEVKLMGGNAWPASRWAKEAGSNTHEILTNISERVKRNYI